MRILVTVASKHGATHAIGDTIAETLRDLGLDVDNELPQYVYNVDSYDAFVIGSAVYIRRWLEPARAFVRRHAVVLRGRPVWLFSSGPLGDVAGPVEGPTDIPRLTKLSDACDHRIFSGRLMPHELGFGERAIVRVSKAPIGDYRNWSDISAWARSIAETLEAGAMTTVEPVPLAAPFEPVEPEPVG